MKISTKRNRPIYFLIFFLGIAAISIIYVNKMDIGAEAKYAESGESRESGEPVDPDLNAAVDQNRENTKDFVDIEENVENSDDDVVDSNISVYEKLFITEERKNYQSGDLQLVIPKLDIDAPVWNGTKTDDLNQGACLYEYAQLPGEGDRNVSIAAHRNGRHKGVVNDNGLFYYIDQLEEGDSLYLIDAENIYQYLYESTYVVEANDWAPIYLQGYSCLTLTSCEPIGISTHRIIVHSKLVATK